MEKYLTKDKTGFQVDLPSGQAIGKDALAQLNRALPDGWRIKALPAGGYRVAPPSDATGLRFSRWFRVTTGPNCRVVFTDAPAAKKSKAGAK